MSRRLLILLAVLALAVGVLTPVAAGAADESVELSGTQTTVEKSEYGSYIVVMTADPLLADFDQDQLDSKAAKKQAKGLAKGHDRALKDAGINTDVKVNEYVNALNGFSALLSYNQAVALAAEKSVAIVMPDELRQPDTDASPEFLGLSDPAGPWQTGYDGEGVVVGIIDSGIWPEHPSFADDGSYSAPSIAPLDNLRPNCEFGNTAHNANDAPFACNNKLVGARQMLDTYRAVLGALPDEYDSARDDNGHGTHTASTSAGNADVTASMFGEEVGTISGIAPRAHVIAYKGLGDLGGFSSDLAAAIDQAVFDGVDVINYSIGGGASLTGSDDFAFLFAADAGVFVATSAGNSGPGPDTVGGPGSVPWLTTVGASTQTRFIQGTIVLGDGSEYYGASITLGVEAAPLIDAEFAGGDLCVPGTLDPDAVEGNVVLCRRGAIARADKSLAVSQAGGIGMVMYNNSDDDNLFTDTHWVPSVHIDNTPGLAIKSYIAADTSPTAAIVDTQTNTEWSSAPSMTIFSSRGPNEIAADIIKPDITAPGMQILAGNSPTPIGAVPGELFQAIAGTSMSSPHIAGIYALIKQAHPDWSAAMAKSAIMTTAYQDVVDNDRVSPADPFDMGAGHVDPGAKVHKGSAFQPGLVYDAGFYEYLGFLCDAAPEAFGDPAGTCGFLESIGVPTDASDLNLASIGVGELPGSQTVTRTVTSVAKERGWRTYTVNVDAPAGYEVTVVPSSFKLKTGQSATYEVTITNVSAPIGEWRHGSLTWSEKTGHYDVYSPISVRAALFDAPGEVSGIGETGTASFPVTFGYTGSYSAAPHGLVPATVTEDTVLQDPDQDFDPDDGFSNRHDFNLSGAAFFRVELPPDGVDDPNIDLDI
ncbi:MAG: S8 family serine peptidase, partial [Actinomycetota bacterium]|nr:S8 family serine peptidase [Actinomycetota bacterium]